MEEPKFYNVKVGTKTRAGNLNVTYSFVAQSDKPLGTVCIYYVSRYRGLSVEVEHITEVVKDEIKVDSAAKESYTDDSVSSADTKISQLEHKIKKLESAYFNKIEGTIRYDNISGEVTTDLRKLEALNNEYLKLKREIIAKIRAVLFEKHKHLVLDSVEIRDFTHDTGNIPFTLKLKGVVKQTIEE